jgi:hypothetical protein
MSLEESNGQLPPETFDTDQHIITVPPLSDGVPTFITVIDKGAKLKLDSGEDYHSVGVVLTNSKQYNSYFTAHFKDGYLILNCVTADEL